MFFLPDAAACNDYAINARPGQAMEKAL